jgi:SAM-dependent methyltransferase
VSGAEERLANDPTSELWGEHRSRYRFAARLAGPGQHVLDVASGAGFGLALLERSGAWPVGVDYSAHALADVRERQPLTPLVRADATRLPFADESFDLVVSRHPTMTRWDEIARVLRPGGTYLSQQIGNGTMRELTVAMMGPVPAGTARDTGRAVAAAEAAGLRVVDLREVALRAEFFDIGAVVHFLRKVIWTVPGFTVEAYREQLRALHERIEAEGRFVAWSRRFLIEAVKAGAPTSAS